MKSKNRVHPAYKEGSKDWKAQYDMLLDDGVTCADCMHVNRCTSMFGSDPEHDYCQFYPNRFTRNYAKLYRQKMDALRHLVRCLDGEREATHMWVYEVISPDCDMDWALESRRAMLFCTSRTREARAALRVAEDGQP